MVLFQRTGTELNWESGGLDQEVYIHQWDSASKFLTCSDVIILAFKGDRLVDLQGLITYDSVTISKSYKCNSRCLV